MPIVDGEMRASGTLTIDLTIDPEGRLVEFRTERHAFVVGGFELRP